MQKEPSSLGVASLVGDRFRDASNSVENVEPEIVSLAGIHRFQREQLYSARKVLVSRVWSDREQYRMHVASKRFFIPGRYQIPCPSINCFFCLFLFERWRHVWTKVHMRYQ